VIVKLVLICYGSLFPPVNKKKLIIIATFNLRIARNKITIVRNKVAILRDEVAILRNKVTIARQRHFISQF